MKYYSLVRYAIALLFFGSIYGQESTTSELYLQLMKMDSVVFDEGFNKCNLQDLEQVISADFEFYHDLNGIQNKEQFLKTFKESICSNPSFKPIRKLVPKPLEVFELKNNGKRYGAIQRGIHEFYIKKPNKELYITNIAKFTSLWILEGDIWKLSRVLSFDHQIP